MQPHTNSDSTHAISRLHRFSRARGRAVTRRVLTADLAVVGGGLAGCCAAITAARAGLKVVLLQDRPVPGGNASSEVRLWVLGATAHMGSNNRWAREGGVIDELLTENLWRNPEGNPVLFDALLLDWLRREPNLTLRLNSAVSRLKRRGDGGIASVTAYCSQDQSETTVDAHLFCDASGDGILGWLSGAPCRVGAEAKEEFGEGMAPDAAYGYLLGHTIMFRARDTGRPVTFVPPDSALADITRIPRWGQLHPSRDGCAMWWLEYGGRLDTVGDTEAIRDTLWSVVYGVWNHIKNSGRFPEAANLALDWVGLIPGKRESRRFEGDYMLNQRDLVERRPFSDAVAHGGWSVDLHPADGVFSPLPGCNQWYARGVYAIPYRCFFSRAVPNLFVAGRLISASHVAFGSTRVMATCAAGGQVVGAAAALCRKHRVTPSGLLHPSRLEALQANLRRQGQVIPGAHQPLPGDLAPLAKVTASSQFTWTQLPDDGPKAALDVARAQLVPIPAGPLPVARVLVTLDRPTSVPLSIYCGNGPGDFTPSERLWHDSPPLPAGTHWARWAPEGITTQGQYMYYRIGPAPGVCVHTTNQRLSATLSVRHLRTQEPPDGLGFERFEIWTPERRPGGHNLALAFEPGVNAWAPDHAVDGYNRPWAGAHCWMARPDDLPAWIQLDWTETHRVRKVLLQCDTDFDHPMESVQWGHPERAMPFCIRDGHLTAGGSRVLARFEGNHQTQVTLTLERPVAVRTLRLVVTATHGAPAALFGFSVWS